MDDHVIIVAGDRIPYRVRMSPLARRMTLRVKPGGEVIVTVPRRFGQRPLEPFLRRQANWLRATVLKLRAIPVQSKTEVRRDYLKHREEARRFVEHRLAFYRHIYGYDHGRISIRNQETRWGSCSRSGNLSFNYRIVKLPLELADYIIVHELCHREELNHSSRFWALVAKAIPNHRALRRRLNQLQLAFE